MSSLFENAVISIRLGIEDFETRNADRMISAARNFYAGLLLLAKECLVRAAPDADPMEVIGAKIKPVSDGDGGARMQVVGWNTIDFGQMKERFRDFNLEWPKGDFEKLRMLRNQVEHYHLIEPVNALKEAIASAFPMVVDFFKILQEDPQEELGVTWDTILANREAFVKVQSACIESLKKVNWPGPVSNLDQMSCNFCKSALVGSASGEDTTSQNFIARCFHCGAEFVNEISVAMVVDASFGADSHLSIREGQDAIINDCPECGASDTYVITDEVDVCYACGENFNQDCYRCGSAIPLYEHNPDFPGLCSWCAHMTEKGMRD